MCLKGKSLLWMVIFLVFFPVSALSSEEPETQGFPFTIELPQRDVAGRDLPDVPRYTPSVRTSYERHTTDGTVYVEITYHTRDNPERVRNFYLKALPGHGWTLLKEESTPGMRYHGFGMGVSTNFEFVHKSCGAKRPCFPRLTLSIGSFSMGANRYTIIDVDYEALERAPLRRPPLRVDTTEEDTPSKRVVPPTGFGKALDRFLKGLFPRAGKPVLVSYSEMTLGETLTVNATYRFSSAVEDPSTVTGGIRDALIERGVSSSAVAVSVDQYGATVSTGGPVLTIGQRTVGVLLIELQRGSSKVNVAVTAM